MKRLLMLIATIVIASSTSASGENLDSLVLSRMFGFRQTLGDSLPELSTNVYMKHLYQTHRRNATLWTVPTLYTIAGGKRAFVSEQYGRFTFKSNEEHEYRRQVYYTTIPRQRNTMSILFEYITPRFCDVTIYGDHILSPFNRENRVYYRYSFSDRTDSTVAIGFRPRFVRNTQLVKGVATVDIATGRLMTVLMDGEFDMLRFRVRCTLGNKGAEVLLPSKSETHVEFKFLGNKVSSHFEAYFGCPTTLPDTLDVRGDRQFIDSLRPVPLSDEERYVYAANDYNNKPQEPSPTLSDSLSAPVPEASSSDPDSLSAQEPERRHHNYLKEIAWDLIGENLLHSIRARTNDGNGYLKLSPILDPQYISYSGSKGFSYKMRLGARYNFTPYTWIETNPYIGYNFKLREFYWDVPLYIYYNKRLNAHLHFSWGSDNRIGNSGVLEEIRREHGDKPELADKKLDLFDDRYVRIFNSITPMHWLTLETGLVFHRRHALNPEEMKAYGKPTKFRSFAPSLGVKLQPWKQGPVLSVDWERGLKGNNVDMSYERWEADLSMMHRMSHLQTINLRVGSGLYTSRGNNYFMDYTNFRDRNLPEGWDDDWAGNFQLLSSDLYNVSNYYIRGNISYEAPLLIAAFTPLLGRYVERERFYWSGLSIADTRFYSELGYGFTCRYASLAFFASFFNTHYKEFGCKFTFELFRRW